MKTLTTLSTFVLLFFRVYGEFEWWQTMSLYQICPRSFKDSDGDGIGDLKGIQSKLQHLVDSGFDAFWLTPFYPSPFQDFGYDISDFREIDPTYGTMKDFEDLLEMAHNMSLKVIIDFVPNHSSDEHEWFKKSVKKIDPYTDYYIWHEGIIVDGERKPPNNWVSLFGGSAWTWVEEREAYFYHQFAIGQPDFDFRNDKVVEEIKDILRFWIAKGVDGFRMDALPFVFEDAKLRNEKLSGRTNNSDEFDYIYHDLTMHLIENYGMVRQWRSVLDEYETGPVMMVEAYANISMTMLYYDYGAHFPFNFGFITNVDKHSNAKKFKHIIDEWMENLPAVATSSWVAGNHDQRRLINRFGPDLAPIVTIMVNILPGVAVTYLGDEICMVDTYLTWEETKDPQGCNAGKDKYAERSRDPERTPFQWDATISAGFSTNSKTWLRVNDNYKTLNLAAQKAADKSCYKSFLKVSRLRKWPAVVKGSLVTKLLNNDVFAFSRELKNERSIYVLINLSYKTECVNLKAFNKIPCKLQLYHSTSNIEYSNPYIVNTNNVSLPGRSASIFVSL